MSAERPFRVLVTCGVFEPGFRGGGPVRSVTQIVDTASEPVEITLVTRDRDLGAGDPYPGLSGHWVSRARSRVFYLNVHSPRHWLRLCHELYAVPFDLLYVNSLFSPLFTMVPLIATGLGLIHAEKILIAPRGECSPGALAFKARKKRLFLRGYGGALKKLSVVWHACTSREATDIRTLWPWATVEINVNQVVLPFEPLPPVVNEGALRLVFIGRISATKNLSLILEALQGGSIHAEFDIYGPLEDPAYWSKCQSLIVQLPSTVRVRYRGELPWADVRDIFARYDAFVFPTLGESFGHVIAESLSASCPVICSAETPWTTVLEAGGGTVVRDLTAQGLRNILQMVAAKTPSERLQQRVAAGRAYRAWRQDIDGPNILDQARLSFPSLAAAAAAGRDSIGFGDVQYVAGDPEDCAESKEPGNR